ncbi:GntR family transcriptional regulator [Niallia circulans]|jgi:GntR family transcriptional regulator, rspAB operon transcriptional repressor|uniref:GntR family transcriptional regulator n=1 Tax=Shouchella clausii TaxID=79880 RepID=A0A268S0G3_SHOCL|nr:GntR family transcriptional regulator [Shouchella clausii]SPU18238.1 GntR family transcriptional regulator [Niallia circulans]AST95699.1 GntR family transcriptional regulator [Shouchella clausii]MCM3547863.1 GntR family transcriptional regulator [Shouchella clausii]MEB5472102.1 GntR family transcriptional regulator [Shouchella clausii]MEB5478967.1 GntR family transcriptional regulator [Shouchella clausii]
MDRFVRKRYSTTDFVYETIKEQIMTLVLPPGSSISEKDIAEELEVSRTPVRESFLRLSEDDLLDIRPQRGSFVTKIDLSHVEDARFLREHMEVATIRLACETVTEKALLLLEENVVKQKQAKEREDEEELFALDREFHRLISEGTGKLRIWEVVQKMNTHLNRALKLSIHSKLNWNLLIQHHEGMAQAIRAKQADEAEALVRDHLKLITYDQYELKEAYPTYFEEE